MDQDHEFEPASRAIGRRHVLALFGTTAGLALLTGCGRSTGAATNAAAAAPLHPTARPGAPDVLSGGGPPSAPPTADPTPSPVPRGTTPWAPAGPYAADGPTDPNFLALDGSVRHDLRAGLGTDTDTAPGVPMTVRLTLTNYFDHGRPYNGAAIYLWHANRDGAYSMYGDLATETYLRGVQPAYADGVVEFTSVFPGLEPGRWPHLHLEVYEDVQNAADAGTILRTAQIALPRDACRAVYASPGYGTAATRFGQAGLGADPVFSTGTTGRLATASGSVAKGYTVELTVEV